MTPFAVKSGAFDHYAGPAPAAPGSQQPSQPSEVPLGAVLSAAAGNGPLSAAAAYSDYPLANTPTPHFLRRFDYRHAGANYVFDESLLAGLEEQNLRRLDRISARAQGLSLAKRPRDESVLAIPAAKRPLMGSAADLLPESVGAAMARSPPLAAPGEPFSDVMTTPGEDQTGMAHDMRPMVTPVVESVEENALLSPTASPRNGDYPMDDHPTPDEFEGGANLASSQSMDDDLAKLIPALVDGFDRLPEDMHRYVLHSMLRSCNRSTMSSLMSIMGPALRCDILGKLPGEISNIVLSYMDAPALCAAAQVSRRWYELIENNTSLWKDLLDRDQLHATEQDYSRAISEAWGYTGWTQETTSETSPMRRQLASVLEPGPVPNPLPPAPTEPLPVPRNALGNPVNLYKAVYRRKRLIAQNWMSPLAQPRHFSIPCAASDVITCLEFDEDRIIAGSDGRYINVYNTRNGELLHHFDDHDGGVWALKYVNKDTLVSGSTDRTVRVWSISKARCTHVFRGHTSTVRCLDIVQPVRRVDPITGKVTLTPPRSVIVTGSRDATLRMWNLPGPDDPEYFADAVPDDNNNDDPFFIRALHGHSNPVRAINGYADTVVSGSYDTTVRVWKISTGECRWELMGHQQKVYSAVIDPKRNRCISASMDWSVKVWCIDTGSLLYTLEGHTSLVGLLDLNRTTLVSAAADSTLRVWDPETGMLLHKLEGHHRAITCFQHDESKVISGSEKTLKLWNIKTGELVGDLFEGVDLTNIWQVGFDARRCVSAVSRGNGSFLEVLDFDYDPSTVKGPRRRITLPAAGSAQATHPVIPHGGANPIQLYARAIGGEEILEDGDNDEAQGIVENGDDGDHAGNGEDDTVEVVDIVPTRFAEEPNAVQGPRPPHNTPNPNPARWLRTRRRII